MNGWLVDSRLPQAWRAIRQSPIRMADGPKDGDKNAEGLVFHGHRWHSPEDVAHAQESKQASPVSTWADKRFKNPEHAKAFAAWFGDSKVVNENGEPLVVYHGATTSFDAFKKFEGDEHHEVDRLARIGHFFTSSKDYASRLATDKSLSVGEREEVSPNVMAVMLRIDTPKTYESYDDFVDDVGDKDPEVYARLLWGKGHDGIWIKNASTDYSDITADQWVAFTGKQIKSATGNRGSFDPKNPHIGMSIRMATAECPPGYRAHQLETGPHKGQEKCRKKVGESYWYADPKSAQRLQKNKLRAKRRQKVETQNKRRKQVAVAKTVIKSAVAGQAILNGKIAEKAGAPKWVARGVTAISLLGDALSLHGLGGWRIGSYLVGGVIGIVAPKATRDVLAQQVKDVRKSLSFKKLAVDEQDLVELAKAAMASGNPGEYLTAVAMAVAEGDSLVKAKQVADAIFKPQTMSLGRYGGRVIMMDKSPRPSHGQTNVKGWKYWGPTKRYVTAKTFEKRSGGKTSGETAVKHQPAPKKEAWEMTRDEYIANWKDVIARNNANDNPPKHLRRSFRKYAFSDGTTTYISEQTAKDINNPQLERIVKDRGNKAEVRAALAAGKPVPAEVLKDYPDLMPKASRTVEPKSDPVGDLMADLAQNKDATDDPQRALDIGQQLADQFPAGKETKQPVVKQPATKVKATKPVAPQIPAPPAKKRSVKKRQRIGDPVIAAKPVSKPSAPVDPRETTEYRQWLAEVTARRGEQLKQSQAKRKSGGSKPKMVERPSVTHSEDDYLPETVRRDLRQQGVQSQPAEPDRAPGVPAKPAIDQPKPEPPKKWKFTQADVDTINRVGSQIEDMTAHTERESVAQTVQRVMDHLTGLGGKEPLDDKTIVGVARSMTGRPSGPDAISTVPDALRAIRETVKQYRKDFMRENKIKEPDAPPTPQNWRDAFNRVAKDVGGRQNFSRARQGGAVLVNGWSFNGVPV